MLAQYQATRNHVKRHYFLLCLAWTLVLLFSFLLDSWLGKEEIRKLALTAAQASYNKDIVYRRWAAGHGGVYVPVSETTPPSPWLAHIPERDITTPAGKSLTLINPAYMTRQVHELARGQYKTKGHITSLKPINPGNGPDNWEKEALKKFATGAEEVVSIEDLNGEPHLRYMKRLITEERCLKCHAQQGYTKGDVRGGLSTSVPLAPYYAAGAAKRGAMIGGHLAIWLLGLLFFLTGYRKFQQQRLREQDLAAALQQSEQRYRRLTENAQDMIYRMALPSGKYEYVNQAATRIFGYTPQEFYETPLLIRQVIHPDRRDNFKAEWEELLAGKMPPHYEYRIISKSGETRWLNQRNVLVKDDAGQPLAIEGIMTDVTEERAIAEEKERLQLRLSQAQKMEAIGTMAGGIAHDFNNILTSIIGYTEIVRDEVVKDNRVSDDINQILLAAGRAANLVKQILTFSRTSENNLVLTQPHIIVKETLKLLRATIPTTVDIRQDIDDHCGAVFADPGKLQQVLMNLISNAVHAVNEKGAIEIRLREHELGRDDIPADKEIDPGRYIELTVIDNGTGIDRATLEKIFDPFFTTKKLGQGTGMGLAVVHGIIESHHGFITVDSEPGRGTAFHVLIPVAGKVTVAPEKTAEEPVEVSGNERILFVDDEPPLEILGRRTLENLGYRVSSFSGSLAALAAFQASPQEFDLIITDQTMPEMSGTEMAAAILKIRSDVPIILCTGYSSKVSQDDYQKLGISAFIMKPYDKPLFTRTVRQVLDQNKDRGPKSSPPQDRAE
jgi:PAS domain S-box-containing protein